MKEQQLKEEWARVITTKEGYMTPHEISQAQYAADFWLSKRRAELEGIKREIDKAWEYVDDLLS